MSAWSGTRPGTRAGCRKRRASFSTCCELPFRPEAPTLRAKQFGKFNLLRFETGSENMMATARLRPQMMRLTDAAADRIKSVMANAGRPIVGVRVGVKNGGCAGMAYTMEYAEQVEPSDEVVEDKGVRVLIDPKAVLFLLGTEMGYKVEKLAAQFVFNNPNQTSACGCGESVQLTPATETH